MPDASNEIKFLQCDLFVKEPKWSEVDAHSIFLWNQSPGYQPLLEFPQINSQWEAAIDLPIFHLLSSREFQSISCLLASRNLLAVFQSNSSLVLTFLLQISSFRLEHSHQSRDYHIILEYSQLHSQWDAAIDLTIFRLLSSREFQLISCPPASLIFWAVFRHN